MAPQKLLSDRLRAQLPKLHATDAMPMAEKLAVAKFFTADSNWTWYAVEFDGKDTFFGLVEGFEREYGYFSLLEMESLRGPRGLPMERDLYFKPTPLVKLDSSLRVDAHPTQKAGACESAMSARLQATDPAPRITLTHRGTISLIGTRKADDVAEPGAKISGPECAATILMKLIGKEDREHLAVLMLNGAHQVVSANIVSIGTVNFAPVHPREFFKAAILQNAKAVICGHNHPSGDLTPSTEDKMVASMLNRAGQLLQIPLLDFLIVSESRFLSFGEDRLMEFGPARILETAQSHQTDARSNLVDGTARAARKPNQYALKGELDAEEEQELERSR